MPISYMQQLAAVSKTSDCLSLYLFSEALFHLLSLLVLDCLGWPDRMRG